MPCGDVIASNNIRVPHGNAFCPGWVRSCQPIRRFDPETIDDTATYKEPESYPGGI